MLKHVFEAISVAAGLCAAWLWWRSSRVPVPERTPPFPPGQVTGDPHLEMLSEAFATTQNLSNVSQAVRETSRISSRAAALTAISVAAQAIATVLGWIPSG